jgi:thioredoxin:protein disulfide reductase
MERDGRFAFDRRSAARLIGAGFSALILGVLALACVLLGLAQPGNAQLMPKPGDIVKLGTIALNKPLAAGQTSILHVTAEVMPGWHINSDHPLNADLIPTHLGIELPSSAKDIKVGTVIYPSPELMPLSFAPGQPLSVFSGTIKLSVPLIPAPSFKPSASIPATVRLNYQPCNDNECLIPASVSAGVDLGQGSKKAGAAGLLASQGNGSDEGTFANIFRSHGYLFGFILVLLGGLALNLTPCVYPLIAVTLAYFGNQAGTTRQIVMLAISYVLGIVLMFSGVGVAVAMSGGIFGAALQSSFVLGAIALMLLALAASSFGFFSLQPPQWLMARAGTARPGYVGALVMGLGMGVVAAPCIGPIVLGLLLLVEKSRSVLFGVALFSTLGLGLGSPYVAIALAAGSIRRLPRAGEWLGWIEQLFGFVLVGLALYFIAPIVPHDFVTRLLPWYAVAVGIFLGFVSPAGRNWRPFWVFRVAVGLISIAGVVYLLLPKPNRPALDFQPFNSGLLADAQAAHKPVVIDFSADWCIPCREMERTTFVDRSVVNEASRFLKLRADLTEQDHRSEVLTKQFGVQGVPTAVFIDSQGKIRKRVVGYIGPTQFAQDLREID